MDNTSFNQENNGNNEEQDLTPEMDNIGSEEINTDDETINIINQLSQKDKETVKAYAKSLIDDNSSNENEDNINMNDGLNMDTSIQENFIFSKKQINNIMETFRDIDDVEKNEKKSIKKHMSNPKNSPFNSPEFK